MDISPIITCFGNIGVVVDSLSESSNLLDYLDNSITFMTFILEVEQTFDIEVPDEYLRPDRLVTVHDLMLMVDEFSVSKA